MSVPQWMQRRGIKPAKPKRRVRGLGDVVHAVTTSTGIAAAVHALAGEDCGCERRRELLNGLLPFGSSDASDAPQEPVAGDDG